MCESIEINDEFLDEFLYIRNFSMDLAMQFIFNDQNVKKNTIQDLKEYNFQFLSTQARKGEQLVSLMPAIKKTLDVMGDNIVELSTEDETFKNQIGDYDVKYLEELKAELLKQIDDEERASLTKSRMKKQTNKQI